MKEDLIVGKQNLDIVFKILEYSIESLIAEKAAIALGEVYRNASFAYHDIDKFGKKHDIYSF